MGMGMGWSIDRDIYRGFYMKYIFVEILGVFSEREKRMRERVRDEISAIIKL